jgi:pimeloyl-ACP methyl ester carboxylesterase
MEFPFRYYFMTSLHTKNLTGSACLKQTPPTKWTTEAQIVSSMVSALQVKQAAHVGHSTGGGEVARYVRQHGKGKVSKAILASALPPIMVKSTTNLDGAPLSVFDDIRKTPSSLDVQMDMTIPLYGPNCPGAKVFEAATELMALGHDGRRLGGL